MERESPVSVAAPPHFVVLFSLPEERKPFRASGVVVSVSGMGAANGVKAAERLLAEADPLSTRLLICGFAGGLTPEGRPGDLVLADRVLDATDSRQNVSPYFKADAELFTAAKRVRVPGLTIREGLLATASRVLTTPAEKHAFAARTGAVAVDMETAGAVQVAQSYRVPWLVLRVLTDGLEDALPLDFNAFATSDGQVQIGRIMAHVLTHPAKIPALLRLGGRSSLAAKNLAAFLNAFLESQTGGAS